MKNLFWLSACVTSVFMQTVWPSMLLHHIFYALTDFFSFSDLPKFEICGITIDYMAYQQFFFVTVNFLILGYKSKIELSVNTSANTVW